MIRRRVTSGAAILFIGAALTGCSRSPQVNFYTLGHASGSATVSSSKGAPSVSVVNLTLPELVDRPQLVEHAFGNRVEIQETHRWAEPLKKGISRLLAENLANRLGSDLVSVYPQSAANDPDYRVYADIQRFESMDAAVYVDVIWSIRRTASGAAKTGRSQVRASRIRDGYESLIAAYNMAIASVSYDIAQTISAEWAAGR